MDTKKCSKCSEEKPTAEFYRSSRAKDGRQSHCKDCQYSYPRNPEKHRLNCARWRKANRRTVNAKSLRWREKNRAYLSKQAVEANKRGVEVLSDNYIRSKILGLTAEQAPPELIEAKRVQLQIHRLLRDMTK